MILFALLLMLFGSVDAAAQSGTLSINVTQGSVPVPAGAQAAGFTTLAFNGDFSQGIDLGCWPGQDTQKHTWYQGIWFAGGFTVPCTRVNLVNDAVFGKQVVDLTWCGSAGGPICNVADNATYGATMISTINQAHTLVTDFPINAYYETVFRVQVTPNVTEASGIPSLGGSWWNTWMWGSQVVQGTNPNAPVIEYDIMEQHGFDPTSISSGCINWGLGGPGHGCGNGYNQRFANFDFRQPHTFGYRITSDGATDVQVCGYLDNVFQGCSDATASGTEFTQRNFLMASMGWGCAFTNGYGNCQNKPLDNVYSCPAGAFQGQICFTINPTTQFNGLVYPANGPDAYIAGIQGILNCCGVWSIVPLNSGSATDWVLRGSNFNGTWVPGTGQLNPYQQIDMYLASFRVWSCASWQTTECNGPVLSGPP